MKIITILGLIGDTKPSQEKNGNKKFIKKTEEDKALYEIDENLKYLLPIKKQRYTNMFPLLVDTFGKENVFAISTPKAKEIQVKVLKFEELKYNEQNFINIKELEQKEEEFNNFFSIINGQLDDEELIVDLSHGFRHLPLLTLVALIAHNIKDNSKIKHILFAQEVEQNKRYKIIDLNKYLDIATISYALTSFTQNYTIAHLELKTTSYNKLLTELKKLSRNILSNNLYKIYETDLLDGILNAIKELEEEKEIKSIAEFLRSIKLHINTLKSYKKYSDYKKLYYFAKQLKDKGYLLNAITILNEAFPLYVIQSMEIDTKDKDPYKIAQAISHYIKTSDINTDLIGNIDKYYYCSNYENVFLKLKPLQHKLKEVRNDLAHAYGGNIETSKNMRVHIDDIFIDFNKHIIKDDIGTQLSTSINKNAEACLYNNNIFQANVNKMFTKLFPNSVKDIFKKTKSGKNRIEILKDNTNIPPTWNITKPYTNNQERLIDTVYDYTQEGNDANKERIMKKFYELSKDS